MNVMLVDLTGALEQSLGDFASWEEAEAEVARRCGGSLPNARPVPTNKDANTFASVRRIAEYGFGDVVFRLAYFVS